MIDSEWLFYQDCYQNIDTIIDEIENSEQPNHFWLISPFCHFDGNDDCCHDYNNDEKSFWPASRPAALGDWTALESRWKRGLPVAHSESYFI